MLLKAFVLVAFVLLSTKAVQGEAEAGHSLPTSADRVRPMLVGAQLPSVQLRTTEGASVDLAVLSEKSTVLIVYRGSW